MISRLILIVFVLMFIVIHGARAADGQQGGGAPRVALVIGNASYPNADPPLVQPVGNAHAFADELRHDGFDVDVKTNLNKEGMQQAFARLYERIKPGAVALIFYSGFGIQSNRQSYMIPVDAQIYKEDDVRHDGIGVDRVLQEMKDRGAGVKIIIMDASRRNRYETNFRVASLGLALPANPPIGTLVLYSAGPGSLVRDSAEEKSLFVSELLSEMRAPGVSADEVFSRTRMGVLRASRGEQNPFNTSSLNEDFDFVPNASVNKPANAEQPKTQGDLTDWEQAAIKESREHVAPAGPGPDVSTGPPPPPVTPAPKFGPQGKDLDDIKNLDTYLGNHPDDAAAFYRRGQLYAKTGDFATSVKDFDEALRLHPQYAEAFNNRCWARAMLGDSLAALKDCDEALELRPDYADALDSRGFVELKIGEPKNAIADYNAALRLKRQASSFYGRGLARKLRGDPTGSRRDIAAAKAIDPSVTAEFERGGLR
ncbi:MAG: caspase family protein [Methylocapsa sp.]|nr:caspase family protein [Methylocapsa sp.]